MVDTPHIDLRTDLSRLRAALTAGNVSLSGDCWYAAPCILGSLFDVATRVRLDNGFPDGLGDTSISTLIARGLVTTPADQVDDLIQLQKISDTTPAPDQVSALFTLLDELEPKYA